MLIVNEQIEYICWKNINDEQLHLQIYKLAVLKKTNITMTNNSDWFIKALTALKNQLYICNVLP